MKRIYYTTSDNGDGSASVWFLESKECITLLEDKDPEGFCMGEGGGYFDVEGTVSKINVKTMKEIKEYLEEMGFND